MMVTSIKCITVKDYLTCIYNGKKNENDKYMYMRP